MIQASLGAREQRGTKVPMETEEAAKSLKDRRRPKKSERLSDRDSVLGIPNGVLWS